MIIACSRCNIVVGEMHFAACLAFAGQQVSFFVFRHRARPASHKKKRKDQPPIKVVGVQLRTNTNNPQAGDRLIG